MYGFGDDQVPFTESVDLLEDLVVEYITEMVRKQLKIPVYLSCSISFCKSPISTEKAHIINDLNPAVALNRTAILRKSSSVSSQYI